MKKYSIWDWGYRWEHDNNVAMLHTVAQGCRWNITRAGNGVISTRLCLYSWKGRVRLRPIKASNTKNVECCRHGDATAAPQRGINEKIRASPAGRSRYSVTELELRDGGGLQGTHSPIWPRHSGKQTPLSTHCTSSFHIFSIPAHADRKDEIHFQMCRS